ncbi:3-isopropylmalate dehydratase small subunit [Pacificimonas flava]|uniref:3-isopropylmalate dehydratase small subunit n=1 Tax=Pacificimonas flava TaxID=1234595 RepID=M2U546_9SPHN|nr:3-isopropylmalate dehydratase small subunit [Pacificimonas flava]EMD83157.1 3-isopropylmalate dehydratase small subunit [Pacificimonas flava]MBB5279278.1 3-isopropylmalate/(R)-2-methylmalate dehydratase small subunit [Pacificimonas flava]
MTPFDTLTGTAVPFGLENVDTDIIIPAKYLKAVTRTGLGRGAFDSIRSADPDNIFDRPRYAGAPILIAGDNFGCGSSREHAPWALTDMGFRAVIAPSFADIFAGNSFKNGMLLVELPQEQVDRLMAVAETDDITIDLENQVVTTPFQDRFAFDIDPFRKHCLLNGLDEIGLTEALTPAIDRYEGRIADSFPWLGGAAGRTDTERAR